MAQTVMLILVGATSMGAVVAGTRGLGLPRAGLRPAIGNALECLGSIAVFLIVNVVLGVVAIIIGRSVSGVFVSTYVIGDAMVVLASILQGLVFHCWRGCTGRREGAA